MEKIVKINWDKPEEKNWLCDANIKIALEHYCKNTHFEVTELLDKKEDLSKYAHDAWTGWMKYMFAKSEINADGTWTIPKWAVERWQRQMNTEYKNLPEDEKKSDRKEADKMLLIINS